MAIYYLVRGKWLLKSGAGHLLVITAKWVGNVEAMVEAGRSGRGTVRMLGSVARTNCAERRSEQS